MGRETTPLANQLSSVQNQNPVYPKLLFLFLLLGVTVFLYSSRSDYYLSSALQIGKPFASNPEKTDLRFKSNDTVLEPQAPTKSNIREDTSLPESEKDVLTPVVVSPPPSPPPSPPSTSNEPSKEAAKPKCDLFKGNWVPNPKAPAYNNYTCQYIGAQQACITNGRPDSGYLFWRWKPKDCDLPKFNPKNFLNSMRNKGFAFIGDSILRNQLQSMLCILSQVELPLQLYQAEQTRSSSWFFLSYNFTLSGIWAPFLLKADLFDNQNGVLTSDIKLHLDKLDENWTKQYNDFDYVMIGGGQWFLRTAIYHEKNKVQGCHYCEGKNLTELGFDYSYRKALSLTFKFITSSSHKPQVMFRTITPSHFEYGKWNEGGYCNRKAPFKETEANLGEFDKIMYEVEMQEFEKASTKASKKGASLTLFDATHLSLLRPDGHPGPYRDYYPFAKDKKAIVQNDCLHWCLPGPIDTWNELISEMLMRG